MPNISIQNMIGKTIYRITSNTNERPGTGDDALKMHCADGTTYVFHHVQDCCEHVSIEEVIGEFDHLLNTPLLDAREDTNHSPSERNDSATWTFYTFITINGTVVVRWLGTSNGYYSERVDIRCEYPILEALRSGVTVQ